MRDKFYGHERAQYIAAMRELNRYVVFPPGGLTGWWQMDDIWLNAFLNRYTGTVHSALEITGMANCYTSGGNLKALTPLQLVQSVEMAILAARKHADAIVRSYMVQGLALPPDGSCDMAMNSHRVDNSKFKLAPELRGID